MKTKTFTQVYNQWGRIAEYIGSRYPEGSKFWEYLNTWVRYKDNICKQFRVSEGYMFGRMNQLNSLANRPIPASIYAK